MSSYFHRNLRQSSFRDFESTRKYGSNVAIVTNVAIKPSLHSGGVKTLHLMPTKLQIASTPGLAFRRDLNGVLAATKRVARCPSATAKFQKALGRLLG